MNNFISVAHVFWYFLEARILRNSICWPLPFCYVKHVTCRENYRTTEAGSDLEVICKKAGSGSWKWSPGSDL